LDATASQESRCRDRTAPEAPDDRVDVLGEADFIRAKSGAGGRYRNFVSRSLS
jgi:hypothetical protein